MLLRFCLYFFIFLACQIDILGQSQLIKPLRLNDIIYHPIEDKIYAAGPGELKDGNAVYIINPNTGVIEDRILVGSEPIVIRFSDNYQYLFIGYYGLNEVHRYHMQTEQLEVLGSFTDSRYEMDPLYTNDLLPIPGKPELLVVALRNHRIRPESAITLVLDGTTQLPDKLNLREDRRNLVADPNTGHIYGFGHEYYPASLMRYEVDGRGIRATGQYDSFFSGKHGELEIYGDQLFNQLGQIADLSGDTPIELAAQFTANVIGIDPTNGYIYTIHYKQFFSSSQDNSYYLEVIDPSNFQVIGELALPGLNDIPNKMIYTGKPGRFAVISENFRPTPEPTYGQLLIIGACATISPPEKLDIIRTSDSYCQFDTATFTASGNYTTYNWSNGSTEPTAQIKIEDFTDVSVNVVNEAGCIIAQSDIIRIKPIVQQDLKNSYQTFQKCASDSIELTANRGNDFFVWSTGDTANVISVQAPGQYMAKGYNGLGCPVTTVVYYEVINYPGSPLPPSKILNPSPIVVCGKETVLLQAADIVYQYEWNGRLTNEQLYPPYFSGVYKLRYFDKNGCVSSQVDSILFTRLELPATPSLTQRDSLLYSRTPGVKQWYFNGNLIEAKGDTLIATKSGFYCIAIKGENGCLSEFSDLKTVTKSYFEAGNSGSISGQIWVDNNLNRVIDSADVPLPYARMHLDSINKVTFSDETGYFEFLVEKNTYELQAIVDTSLWTTIIGTEGYQINLNNTPDTFLTFLITPNTPMNRLSTDIKGGITRCNAEVPFWVTLRNTGNQYFSGTVCLNFDPFITGGTFQGMVFSSSPPELCWQVDSLPLGGVRDWKLTFDMPGIEPEDLGRILQFELLASADTDVSGKDQYESIFRCAYDPNDKLVSPQRGDMGQYALFEDNLEYTIRFQNTGNDTAFTVVLEDQLSADLDWSTFIPLSASHNFDAQLDGATGLLKVHFNNILLPDSTTNLVESQGYFSYNISPIDGLAENTIIDNTAGIFFDLNPPIITNTIESELVSELPMLTSVADIGAQEPHFLLAPNPFDANGKLLISHLEEQAILRIYNVLGVEVFQKEIYIGQPSVNIDGRTWGAGVYYFTIQGAVDALGSGTFIKS